VDGGHDVAVDPDAASRSDDAHTSHASDTSHAGDTTHPADRSRTSRWPSILRVTAACVAAGAGLALSIPPFGFWPFAIAGVAGWDRLLAGQRAGVRARRSWLVSAAWLAPMMLWMWDLTPPGYVVAVVMFAGMFAAAGAAVPADGPWRWLALPAALVLAEQLRWSWPWGGVPLATLAMGQADAPLAQAARVGGALAVSALVGVAGVAVSCALMRHWRAAATACAVLALAVLAGVVAPRGTAIDSLEVAAVQGGGPQRTRASQTDASEVFDRHVAASARVTTPVDLVLWPENVVALSGTLPGSPEADVLGSLARQLDAPIVAGITERISARAFLNASVVVLPDGTIRDRYDKVLRVPFGEFVPFRDLVERLAPDAGLPLRDARAGTGRAVVDTSAGPMAVAISWEVFFTPRARDGVTAGGEVLLNPTNGSSYWLTQVQTQQLASSQLRAIETGRWVVQAAPTGFSAFVDPDGRVVERTGISEQRVLQREIERRQGLTPAMRWGPAPVVLASLLALAGAWWWRRRPVSAPTQPAPTLPAPPDQTTPIPPAGA
jgi:apolipoprotein N-acyltransferase